MYAIWEELDITRAAGFNGPAAISYPEIESWSRLSHRNLTRWAVRMIALFDVIYRSTFYEVSRPRKAGA